MYENLSMTLAILALLTHLYFHFCSSSLYLHYEILVNVKLYEDYIFRVFAPLGHFCTKLTSWSFKRFQPKFKVASIGNWAHNWPPLVTNMMPIQLCSAGLCWIGDSLHWILFHAPLHFVILSRFNTLLLYKDLNVQSWQISTVGWIIIRLSH